MESPDVLSPLGQVQSVDRALTILEIIAEADGEVGVTDLAKRLQIHKSTASRLVATLEAHSLVESTERGRYRLGLGLLGLAAAATVSLDLVKIVHPTLQSLSERSGETANLAVLADHAALYLDQSTGTSTLQAHSWVGQRIPLHATSNGKVLLAFSEREFIDDLAQQGLKRHSSRTITSPAELAREMDTIRCQGWAVSADELEDGLTAVAAPIKGRRGQVLGSLSVSGPTFRMVDDIPALAEMVCSAAAEASTRTSAISG